MSLHASIKHPGVQSLSLMAVPRKGACWGLFIWLLHDPESLSFLGFPSWICTIVFLTTRTKTSAGFCGHYCLLLLLAGTFPSKWQLCLPSDLNGCLICPESPLAGGKEEGVVPALCVCFLTKNLLLWTASQHLERDLRCFVCFSRCLWG